MDSANPVTDVFTLYKPDRDRDEWLHGLHYDDDYLVFKYTRGDGYLSLTRKGDGISVHLACAPGSAKLARQGCADAVEFVFRRFDWCRMILAVVEKPSVGRLAEKMGFVPVAEYDDGDIAYAKVR